MARSNRSSATSPCGPRPTRAGRLASFRDFADDPRADAARTLAAARLAGRRLDQRRRGRQGGDFLSLVGRQELPARRVSDERRRTARRGSHRSASAGIRPSARFAPGCSTPTAALPKGCWTVVDDGIVIKSSSVNPDGTTASATMNITPQRQRPFFDRGNRPDRRRQPRRRFRNHRHAASAGCQQVTPPTMEGTTS